MRDELLLQLNHVVAPEAEVEIASEVGGLGGRRRRIARTPPMKDVVDVCNDRSLNTEGGQKIKD